MAEKIERFQLQGNAPEIYESAKVPSLFRPLAEATLEAVELRPADRVLDVACGTGIVARLAAARLSPDGAVSGVDLNDGMIAKATELGLPGGLQGDWHVADVTDLPFDDAEFDIAFCQQGLQFFPDKAAALAEIRRVLAPGGRLVLTVWMGGSIFGETLAKALRRHVSEAAATRALGPFNFGDGDMIAGLVRDAGFVSVDLREIEINRILGPGDNAFAQDMAGMPYAQDVSAAGDAAIAAIVRDMAENLADYATGTQSGRTYRIPQHTNLIQAVAP